MLNKSEQREAGGQREHSRIEQEREQTSNKHSIKGGGAQRHWHRCDCCAARGLHPTQAAPVGAHARMAPKTAFERSRVRRPRPRARSSSCSYALSVCVCITTVPALLSILAFSRAFLHLGLEKGKSGRPGAGH